MTAGAYGAALQRVRDGADPVVEAAALVAMMTRDEKVHCLDGGVPYWAGIADIYSGGYHRRPFRAARVERLGIPGFHFSDGPRGVVVGPATAFPVSMARGASFDPELEERIGDAIGRELRAVGADLYGGVCVNLLRHPAWGRAQEVYGEDPHHMGEMAAALTRGVQRHVMATVKHFALNSMENARFSVDVTVDERTLHEVYLPHFRRVVDEGVACVMSAYNSVNGEWCGENAPLLTGVLREEWNFAGFVISDWIFGLRDGVKSVRAGLDVEMPYRMVRHAPVGEALDSGALDIADVEAVVTRTVAAMLRHGLGSLAEHDTSILACPEHLALAREAAAKSMVLLRNETVHTAPVLPLDGAALSRVAVIGRLADKRNLGDGGSSDVMAPQVVTPLQGLREALPHVEIRHDTEAGPDEAAKHAAECDVAIVVVGYTKADEGEFIGAGGSGDPALLALMPGDDDPGLVRTYESYMAEHDHDVPPVMRRRESDVRFSAGGDRDSLRLRAEDVALVRAVARAQPRTVVVVVSGSAVVMEEWIDDVPSVVMSWYCGSEGGRALADVLTGAVNPSGRLPFVIPTHEEHLPHFDKDATAVTYDYLHGQWKLDADGVEPRFPFGFGLGYSPVTIEEVSCTLGDDEIAIECDVENHGDRDGSTVVQVYACKPGSEILRAPRRLVAFRHTDVAAGSRARVHLSASLRSLAHRVPSSGDAGRARWMLEPGDWHIEVALHAGDPDRRWMVAGLDERAFER